MKLIIKLPKKKEGSASAVDERKTQHSLATTSGKTTAEQNEEAAFAYGWGDLDLATKVKSRKRKATVKTVATKLGEGLVTVESCGGGDAGEGKKAKKAKKAKGKSKEDKSPTTTKIRFQVADASRGKSGGAALPSHPRPDGSKVVSNKPKKKKGVSLKERIATKEKIKGVLSLIDTMDANEIFKHPVTEAIAPGYFSIVKEPICLSEIRTKLENNHYTAWEVFWKDCVLLFTNAMRYNSDESIFYKTAEDMLKEAARVARDASGGQLDVSDVLQLKGASLLGLLGDRKGSPNNGLWHRRTESNFSGSIFSGADAQDQNQIQSKGNAASSAGAPLAGNKAMDSHTRLKMQYDSKSVIKYALSRRATFKPPEEDRVMGLLRNMTNGEGLPFTDGAKHVNIRNGVNNTAYMASLKKFCQGLPKVASNFIYEMAAEKISPGIAQRAKERKAQELQRQREREAGGLEGKTAAETSDAKNTSSTGTENGVKEEDGKAKGLAEAPPQKPMMVEPHTSPPLPTIKEEGGP
ncbi:bromodomain-containing protein [Chloropicon primus]|uniref:Bromodomain-containing protein n=3 Tax=Chloropicon primus TaxID=1764295 RepID=A0A5B8MMK8_9CHLO|nr:bromodomain-containing protein [Chloropicon primus]UPQ99752.1 bromodomain-containing protein [Chloropicon primus]|eukprot:QDZ20540.1 bromodomain-containing protein [Chloropicon primus]